MTRTTKGRSQEIRDPHWVEWLTGVASALLVLAILVWVGREAFKQTGSAPDLSAEITADSATEAGRRIEFKIVNRSERTAASVTIRGDVVDSANVFQGHEVILDYVPAHSAARGAFIFSGETSGRQIRIRPTAYAEP